MGVRIDNYECGGEEVGVTSILTALSCSIYCGIEMPSDRRMYLSVPVDGDTKLGVINVLSF